jgi:DNA (cytosine-5)-methyltransferase 1
MMAARPRHLELYSCEGGSARGYERAGFDVYCVDLFEDYSRQRCPFPAYRGDVLDVLRRLLAGDLIPFTYLDGMTEMLGLEDFASIGASPPCQHASAGTRAQDRSKYPRLIETTRELLIQAGLPYVIENVKGADLRDPILLCGTMFGLHAMDDDGTRLEMWRHRLFESNVSLLAVHAPYCRTHMAALAPNYGADCTCYFKHGSMACNHGWFSPQVAGSYGGARRDKHEARNVRHGGYVPSKRVQQELLGIDWMTERGMHQSIPPVYTEHIGRQLLAHIEASRAA